MAEPMLRVSDISVSFGGLKALSNVSFEVAKSEILGVIGPNGAGKTTLFNVLSRFVRPQPGGSVVLDSTNLTALPAHKILERGLARTFQSPELINDESVIDNVMAGASLRYRTNMFWAFLGNLRDRRQDSELRDLAYQRLVMFGIEKWAAAPANSAPYAVKKRVQVCRALMTEPKLLLLDEPASGMVASEKNLFRDSLQELHRSTGLSMIVIEHDVGFLAGMSSRMLALNFGSVIGFGSVADVTSSPEVISAYIGEDGAQ